MAALSLRDCRLTLKNRFVHDVHMLLRVWDSAVL